VDLDEAEKLARHHIQTHLPGWSFGWDSSKRMFGRCWYQSKHISLSKILVEINDQAAVLDTIFHEIAHGLAGRAAGHGPDWQKVAMRLGGTGQVRCYVTVPRGKWVARCPGCGVFIRKLKKPKHPCSCFKCSRGVFNIKYVLDFVDLP
jgi:SprT protein